MMWDGRVKMVQDIKVGDQLCGDDSSPRTVLSIARGREKMYKIVSATGGDPYVVNESHILSLRIDDNGDLQWSEPDQQYKISWFDAVTRQFREALVGHDKHKAIECQQKLKIPKVIDIPLTEYLSLPAATQNRMRGFRVPVEWEENRRGLSVDPYELGLSETHSIPLNYKRNSPRIRLEVLAGIIDASGKLLRDSYEISCSDPQLQDDVLFVARSLGFSATIADPSTISLSGNLAEIPTRVAEKKADSSHSKNGVLLTEISIEELTEDDYYGFTLDGNSRYLLGDFTVTHNTFTMDGTRENPGVNFRGLSELFRLAKEREAEYSSEISVSILEIYNEKIRDLLIDPVKRKEKKCISFSVFFLCL
jgi:hypothetical protein